MAFQKQASTKLGPNEGETASYHTVGSIKVFAPQIEISKTDLLTLIDRIETNVSDELHKLRHFSNVSSDYREKLIGQAAEVPGKEHGKVERIVITDQTVDDALKTVGSKFFPNNPIAADPRALVEFGKAQLKKAAENGGLAVFDKGFAQVMYLTVDVGHTIGANSLVSIEGIDPAKIEKRQRGKIGNDELLINYVRGESNEVTNQITFVVGVIDNKPEIWTAYPGPLAPDMPRDGQGPEELAYNLDFWSRHGFVS